MKVMNINICISLVLVCVLSLSCKQENKFDTSCLLINSEFTGKDCAKLSDFVESIEIIPLETNQECLIENIGKIVKHKDFYYIASASNVLNKILVFDKNGRFVYGLDKRGLGPHEYIDIGDFDVIDNDRIVIVSHSNPGIYVYDMVKDSCVLHKSIDINPNSIIAKDSSFYVMNSGSVFHEETNDLIFRYDKQANLIESFFCVNNSTLDVISNIKPLVSLSSYRKDLYFNYPYCDTIYSINDAKAVPAYSLDFGNKALSVEALTEAGDMQRIEKIIQNNKGINLLIYYAINSPYSLFTFMDYQYRGYILIYKSNIYKSIIANEIVDDLYFKGNKIILKPWKLPKLLTDNTIYYHIEPADLIGYYTKYKKRLSNKEWTIFSKSHPKLVSVVNNLSEDDNPILLKMKLKQ